MRVLIPKMQIYNYVHPTNRQKGGGDWKRKKLISADSTMGWLDAQKGSLEVIQAVNTGLSPVPNLTDLRAHGCGLPMTRECKTDVDVRSHRLIQQGTVTKMDQTAHLIST